MGTPPSFFEGRAGNVEWDGGFGSTPPGFLVGWGAAGAEGMGNVEFVEFLEWGACARPRLAHDCGWAPPPVFFREEGLAGAGFGRIGGCLECGSMGGDEVRRERREGMLPVA